MTGLRSFFGSRSRGAVFGGLAALALAVVVTNWPVLDPRWVQSVTYRQWGDGLAGVEQIDPALVRYERAIKLDPDNAVALHNGAMMRARRHEPGVAALYLREALRAVPTYADAHFSLARVLIDAYDPVGAIESYRNGLELDPNRAQAHYDLSRLLYEQGDAVEAQEHFQRAKELNAPSP